MVIARQNFLPNRVGGIWNWRPETHRTRYDTISYGRFKSHAAQDTIRSDAIRYLVSNIMFVDRNSIGSNKSRRTGHDAIRYRMSFTYLVQNKCYKISNGVVLKIQHRVFIVSRRIVSCPVRRVLLLPMLFLPINLMFDTRYHIVLRRIASYRMVSCAFQA